MKLENTVDPTAARALAFAAQSHDGVAPLSEQFLLGLEDPSMGHKHVGLTHQGQLVGVGAISGEEAEFVIAPDHRGKGYGHMLLAALKDAGVTQFWAHGNLDAAQHLASAEGMSITRELLVMGTKDLPRDVDVPQGFRILDLTKLREEFPDADEKWLKTNNEAFDWHPEQGGWDAARLKKAQQTQWFRAEDVLFVVDDKVAGFHWLKRHSATEGEIYVVGLASHARGQGLGGPLITMGLAHLKNTGCEDVHLYVEADNAPAVAAYEKLGFAIRESHAVYS